MDNKTDVINEIEKLSRVTQDQYFIIKELSTTSSTTKTKHELSPEKILELKTAINTIVNSKMYRYVIKRFSKKLKDKIKFLKHLSDRL